MGEATYSISIIITAGLKFYAHSFTETGTVQYCHTDL